MVVNRSGPGRPLGAAAAIAIIVAAAQALEDAEHLGSDRCGACSARADELGDLCARCRLSCSPPPVP